LGKAYTYLRCQFLFCCMSTSPFAQRFSAFSALERNVSDSNAPSVVPPPLESTVWRSVGGISEENNFGVYAQTKSVKSVHSSHLDVGYSKVSALSDSSLMLTKQGLVQASSLPDLKLMPPHIQRHTSFISRCPSGALYGKIVEVLQSGPSGITVDLQPHAGKPKLKGLATSGGTKIVFNLNLYRNPSDECVVECTREEGCTVLFNQLYQQLLAGLGSVVLRRLNESGSHKSSNPPLSTFPPPPSLPAPSLSTFVVVLDLARSPFLNQQIQACETLSELSRGHAASQLLDAAVTQQDVAGLLCSLLRSDSEDVVRLVAVVIENLLKFQSPAFTEKALPMITPLFDLLAVPMTYLNRETKRHVSACLHVLAKARGDAFSLDQRQALERGQFVWEPQATLHVSQAC